MTQDTIADHIIMLDDDENDTYVAKVCFQKSSLNHSWVSFRDAESFLAHLEQVKSGYVPMPALVLLDLNMPGMTGFDVLEVVRNDPFFEERPHFIVLTNSDDERDRREAVALGATRVVSKPDRVGDYVRFFDSLADWFRQAPA